MCRCPAAEPARYRRRVSGPLLDRIDLRVMMPRLDPRELVTLRQPESSDVIARRIAAAWVAAVTRNGGIPNAALNGQRLLHLSALGRSGRRTLEELARQMELTARGVHRLLRVARTIADLDGSTAVAEQHLSAAASLNDRSIEREAAA